MPLFPRTILSGLGLAAFLQEAASVWRARNLTEAGKRALSEQRKPRRKSSLTGATLPPRESR